MYIYTIVKFGNKVSEVDMLSTLVIDDFINSLLERSNNIMQITHSIIQN